MIARLVSGDIFRVSMLLMIVSTLMMVLVKDVRKICTRNKKVAMLYILVIFASCAILGLLSSPKIFNDTPLASFIGIETFVFILGIIHIYTLKMFFPDLVEDKSKFWNEFFLSTIFIGIGIIGLLLVVSRFRPEFKFLFLSAGIVFLIPLIVAKCYEFAMNIPVPIYEKWLYPIGKKIKEPEDSEYANPILVNLEFERQMGDLDFVYEFKIKAPQQMQFGRLFYFFVDDYNYDNKETKIDVTDNRGQPVGWIFYYKPNWWSKMRFVDATKTIAFNRLREQTTIFCQRIVEEEPQKNKSPLKN